MKQWYKVIDVAKCHDCNNCFMADKDEFVGNDWPGYTAAQPRHGHRWVDILRRERGQYARNDVAYLPVPCQHCENAPCVEASDGAIYKRDDGIVMIDLEKAKGNKDLVDSCPYGAIWWNEEADIAQKCIFCAHLIDDPTWKPHTTRCTHSCPTEAMKTYFVEPEEMEKMIAAEDLEAYLPELGTKPHTLYKNLLQVHARTSSPPACWSTATASRARPSPCTRKRAASSATSSAPAWPTATTPRRSRPGPPTSSASSSSTDSRTASTRLEVDAGGRKYSAAVTIDGRVAEPGVHQAVGRTGPARARTSEGEGPSGPSSLVSASARPPGGSRKGDYVA